MATLEEMTAWSLDEIEAEIVAALPPGLHFELKPDESGFWSVSFWRVSDTTKDKQVVWDDVGPDQRIMLFNAYGWLWLRQQPKPPEHSPWQPDRLEITSRVAKSMSRRILIEGGVGRGPSRGSDPEDLDPLEVLAVYELSRKG